jgi:hypothetical protein
VTRLSVRYIETKTYPSHSSTLLNVFLLQYQTPSTPSYHSTATLIPLPATARGDGRTWENKKIIKSSSSKKYHTPSLHRHRHPSSVLWTIILLTLHLPYIPVTSWRIVQTGPPPHTSFHLPYTLIRSRQCLHTL